MKLGRTHFLALVSATTLRLAPRRAWAAAGAAQFVQSDDKSWSLSLPPSWKLDSAQLRADPAHLFRAHATRGADATLDVFVDRESAIPRYAAIPIPRDLFLPRQEENSRIVELAKNARPIFRMYT